MIQSKIADKDFFNLMGRLITSSQMVKAFDEPIITNDNQIWLIELEENMVIGFCCFEAYKGIINIKYLYVDDQYRGNKIASKFIDEVVNYAKANNIFTIQTVSKNMENNIFLKLEFSITKAYTKWAKMELRV